MIFSYNMLLDEYANYANPKTKIKRLVEQGNLYQIRPGIYTDDNKISKYALAHLIYGPSYISFQTALSFWGLIPERAEAVLCATTAKNRTKHFSNAFSEYYYRDVPKNVFPFGITIQKDASGNEYKMASPEKALLDFLYSINNVDSIKKLTALLFEDMRIDEEAFNNLDYNFISEIGPLYKKKNINILIKMMR